MIAILATIALASCQTGDPGGGDAGEVIEGPTVLERFVEAPDAAGLLEVLDQPHAQIRQRVGAHRLQVTSHYEMGPEDPPEVPKVGDRVIRTEVIDDELSLLWLGVDDEDRPRFELHQHNSHDQGRDVVMEAGKVYTRTKHRPWFVRELEGSAHDLWLEDAYRCVRDAVALAAPALELETESSGKSLRVELSAGRGVNRDLVPRDERSAWRHAATIDEVEGHVSIDRASGAWTGADVKIAYHLESVDGRILRGRLELAGALEPLAAPPALKVPTGALPSPERRRPQEERGALLDGLAAQ